MPVVPNFLPSINSLKFTNSWPSQPDILVDVPPFGQIAIGDARNGLCGGMVFTVLDVFEAGHPPLTDPQPSIGHPLFDYIVRRLFDSFNIPGGVLKYLEWMNTPDHDTGINPLIRRGLAWRSIIDECVRVQADIIGGHPSPLALVTVASLNPGDLGQNHQVLAYGFDLAGNIMTLHCYDPNSGGNDLVQISFDISNPTHTTVFNHNVNISHPIRGFFRVDYTFADPTSLQARLLSLQVFDAEFYVHHHPDLLAAFGNDPIAARNHWLGHGVPYEGRRGSREFDVQFYLATYPDLQAAFGRNFTAAFDHWIDQGLPNEGRRGSREFDVQFYLANYPDLQTAFGTNFTAAFDHWLNQGLPNEGRRGSREFDVQFYLAAYPDLQAAFGTNFTAAFDHWVNQGLPNEGRRGSREFDVQFYFAAYPDLQAAFGTNFTAALDHWLRQGLPNEGRRGSREFDVQFYLATYPDLQTALGANFTAALDHWLWQGLPNEGRRGSQEFDVQFYLATYPDLQTALGANFIAAFDHWIHNGIAEGRIGA